MRRRWAIAACGLVALAAAAFACGSESDGAAPPTTAPPSGAPVTLAEGPAAQGDAEYGGAMLELSNVIGRVGPDICMLDSARFDNNMPDPATPAQVQWSEYVYSRWLIELGEALPDHNAAISGVMLELTEAARNAGYPVGFWKSDEVAEIRSDPDFVAAMAEYQTVAVTCSDRVEASTTIPMP